MTKKAVLGFAVVGAVIGLRPLAKRIGRKGHEHCEQMMRPTGDRDGAGGMREHCKEMMGQVEDREPEAVGAP